MLLVVDTITYDLLHAIIANDRIDLDDDLGDLNVDVASTT